MAYLVLMEGEKKGQQFELPSAGQVTLGRSPDNAIVVDGLAVSSRHGMIVVAGDVFTYLDVGSTNGSFINDEPVHEAKLYRGDVVLLGTTPVMIEGEDVPARVGDPSLGGGVGAQPIDIQPRTRAAGNVPRPKNFGVLRNNNIHWMIFIVLIGLAIIAGLSYFFVHLK